MNKNSINSVMVQSLIITIHHMNLFDDKWMWVSPLKIIIFWIKAFIQSGIVNSLRISSDFRLICAAVAQENRLGRWMVNKCRGQNRIFPKKNRFPSNENALLKVGIDPNLLFKVWSASRNNNRKLTHLDIISNIFFINLDLLTPVKER